MSVRHVMAHDVVTIGPDAPVRAAMYLMATRKIGCLPVVHRGTLVGIVSEADCVRHLADTPETEDVEDPDALTHG